MRDDIAELRLALRSIQRAAGAGAETAGSATIGPDAKAALDALDRIEEKTRAYAALARGLAAPQSTWVIADSFLSFFTYIRQDLNLGGDPLRDKPIYTVLDELYDTAKQLRR